MADITETGYQIKTANEWYDDEKKRYQAISPNWNLDPSTPDGLKLATDSEIWATLDELSQLSYNSKDPSKATGLQLDILTYLTTGSPRQLGSFSTVTMELTGLDGTLVAKGTLFESTVDGSQWSTDEGIVVDGGDPTLPPSNLVSATCTQRGATAAAIGDISKIVSPIAGLDSATNSTVATIGTDPETDAQLRERRQKSVAISGNNQTDNIFSSIAVANGVAEVKIYENFSSTTDVETTVPAHSLGIVVRGGDDDDVALAIYTKKNPGCGLASFTNSNNQSLAVTKSVTSPVTGNVANITFNRPEAVDIYINCSIQDDGTLPNSTDPKTPAGYNTVINEIKQSIISYTSGKTELQNGFKQGGFNIGDDVIQSALFTPINQVLGNYGSAYVVSLTIGTDANDLSANPIDILFYQLAQFIDNNMTISISIP